MKKLKLTQAFTLIELIAVMVIILIIASLVVGVGSAARRKALETKAQSMIAALEVAISMYNADTGQYPPTGPGPFPAPPGNLNLYAHLTDEDTYGSGGTSPIAGWKGPYMEFKQGDVSADVILDPWGNAYNYSMGPWTNNPSFDLWSNGPNGVNEWGDNTPPNDDIRNWL